MNTMVYKSMQARKHFSKKEKVLGQFFTPPEVADFIVSFAKQFVDLQNNLACDPACGDGVFLRALKKYGFKPFGVDIDESVLQRLPEDLKQYVQKADGLSLNEKDKFAMVVGNPPFSSKYGRVKGEILKDFELGKGRTSQAIEILFLEKFIKLCADGGVVAIILPHGVFSDMRLGWVREYIKKHLSIIAVISLPRNIFRTVEGKGSAQTCILIGKKSQKPSNEKVLFAEIKSIEEILNKNIKRQTFAEPEDFLYPKYYLERNPKLLKLPKLKDFDIKIIQGVAKYGAERKFSSSGIPFISAKNITAFGIDFSKEKRFVEPGSPMDNKKAYTSIGDVLFVRVGVGCIGRTAVVVSESERGIVDDWIYIIRVRDSRLSPFYLAFWFQTPVIQREIRRLARGVGAITIPIELVRGLPILVPSPDILKKCKTKYLEIVHTRENKQQKKALKIRDEICKELEELLEDLSEPSASSKSAWLV